MCDLDAIKIGSLIKKLPPPLSQCAQNSGSVGFIGGGIESTGPLFYAAITALRVGITASHIFCTRDAAQIIKTYSPEFSVHPILENENCVEKISKFLDQIDVLVLGTGLTADDQEYFKILDDVLLKCQEKAMSLIIDDGYLIHLSENLNSLDEYTGQLLLTPNQKEFHALAKAHVFNSSDGGEEVKEIEIDSKTLAKQLLTRNPNISICVKGLNDEVFNTIFHIKVTEGGSTKRSIGQGSILAGAAASFLFWAKFRINREESGHNYQALVAGCAASVFTRTCNEKAFEKSGRSLNTIDMIKEIHGVFEELFEVDK